MLIGGAAVTSDECAAVIAIALSSVGVRALTFCSFGTSKTKDIGVSLRLAMERRYRWESIEIQMTAKEILPAFSRREGAEV